MRNEIRKTVWRCKDCKIIYNTAKDEGKYVTCIGCGSTNITPITIFEIIESEAN